MQMLKLEQVNVYYGHVQVLKGLSLEVEKGELVSLLGANGAGKSTTLMTISGILHPTSGHIYYEGHDISQLDAKDIVRLGIVHCPEGRRIFGGLTVLENLRMGAVCRKDKRRLQIVLDEIFPLFPILRERLNQISSTLSGGEQQMLAIGRALIAQPRLLMLDEPSLGLAPIIVQGIFKVIRQLHEKGITILLVEQNARQALTVADRCYVMETGNIVLNGSSTELRANPEIEKIYLGQAPEAGKL
jgi:branched-chain amino acid transport system ATP-binding protein